MLRYKRKLFYIIGIFSFIILVGCSSSKGPDPDTEFNIEDVKSMKMIIEKQSVKIENIEKDLEKYKNLISDQTKVLDIYDDNNQNIIEFRKKLADEVNNALLTMRDGSFEKEVTNTLIKVQNKINILEDRTFYTDSLYFEIVNELVMIDNKIETLVASFKEISELSTTVKKRVIPQISDKEYRDKYIEALSSKQNEEWDLSLDGFRYLIEADNNHELADNCQYWIGEVFFSQKEYKRSIVEFKKVFNYPGFPGPSNNKSDHAQFKIVLCHINLKQIDRAKQELETLITSYPNSEKYSESKDLLKKL